MAENQSTMYFDVDAARTLCASILAKTGVPVEDSSIVVDNLIKADLRGIGSHGISRMFVYCERLKDRLVNVNPDVKVVNEAPAALLLDGDNGLGAVIGTRAMEMCIQKAQKSGMAVCTLRNGNHFGIAAYYAMKALEHDMIGITFSNAPPTMAPWGSITPMLGTNPFCFAIPAGKHLPVVLDCATSVVARGKINLAEIENKPIPEGWAMDSLGRPTTNATEGLKGSVLPFGGYKGSGISIIIDVMCAVLSGASYGCHIGNLYDNSQSTQNLGFFFAAIDLKYFQDPAAFKGRIDCMIDEIKNSRKAYGVEEIYVPGEIEFRNEKENLRKGIAIGPGVLRDLKILCKRYGIDEDLLKCIKMEGST